MEFLAELGGGTRRDVIIDDAIMYMEELEDDSISGGVFTSLPDICEIPEVVNEHDEADRHNVYKDWFVDVAALIFRKLADRSYAVFLQSDIRVQNKTNQVTEWIDKSSLIVRAADREGCKLMWHKICLPMDKVTRRLPSLGRPQFSHLVCLCKGAARYSNSAFAAPDVFDRGEMLWPRGIGLDAAYMGLTFLREVAKVRHVLDPFCGVGTVLAMANAMGMDSTGVELSSKRCRKARTLDLRPHLSRMDLKHRCYLGHNPKNDVAVTAAVSSNILGRHDRQDSGRYRDGDFGDDSEEDNDGDERKMEPVDDSPPPSSPATLSPESVDLHGPLHHHRVFGPSLNLSPSPSPTMMMMSPSHRKTLHNSNIGSYSDDERDGSTNNSPTLPPFPSSSSFRRDRSSSSSIDEEGKSGNGNEGDEDKDSELAASEREQRLKELASAKGVDDKDIDDIESPSSINSRQPRGLLPFAPGQPRTYTLASSLALARLSSPLASTSAPRKHWSSAAADEPGRRDYREAMGTSPDTPSAGSSSSMSPQSNVHYMLPIENKGYSPSPVPSPEEVERKLRQDLDREFKYFRGNSNNSLTNNSIADSNSSSHHCYGQLSAPSTPSGPGPGLFLDFNASVTRDGYIPADGSGHDPSPGEGIAAAAIFGGNGGGGSGDRYKHRRQTKESPSSSTATAPRQTSQGQQDGANSSSLPDSLVAMFAATLTSNNKDKDRDNDEVMTGEIGDGWEGVKGLAMALSAHSSPRNSPRDNNSSNDNATTAGGGGGGANHVTGTIDNNTSETPVVARGEDNDGTTGTTASGGGSSVASGNRARSMFAQRLKASTSASAPIPTSKGPQQAEG